MLLYSVCPHQESSFHIYTFVVSRSFMAGAASQAGDADSSRAPGLTSYYRGPWMSTVVLYCWRHRDSASDLLYFTFCHTCSLCPVELVVQFPARGLTQVLLYVFLVCCDCDTSYIVSVHIQSQASIYSLSLCRGHSWRLQLAKQETLTPPWHLVSRLVCRGPWMSTVVLYCWFHSDSA